MSGKTDQPIMQELSERTAAFRPGMAASVVSEDSAIEFNPQLDAKHLGISDGQRRRNAKLLHILSSAAKVLAREGHAKFSFRMVAEEAGIRASSLQHYFETKDSLVVETVRIVVGGYRDRYRAQSLRQDVTNKRILELILEDLMVESDKPEVRAFHLEMWALARHDPRVAELLNQMYEEFRLILLGVVRSINSDLSEVEARAVVVLIGSMAEGLAIMNSYHGSIRAEPGMFPRIVEQIELIINGYGKAGS